MSKLKLTQAEIDKLVVVDRVAALPTVRGVGVVDVDFEISHCGKVIWQYKLWTGMLERSFCEKFKARQSAYKDVTCCAEWLSFGNFLGWVNREVGYGGKPVGAALDKDILVKGNKIYSPEACSFVPTAVNNLLNDNGATRGEFPVGVTFDKCCSEFKVQLRCFGKVKYLGRYDTIEDAAFAYKTAKEAQIKIVALQHKDVLKPAVFESLMSWEVTP